jgi:hypothetical protein
MLGVFTRAQLRLHPVPLARRRGAWRFASFADGADLVEAAETDTGLCLLHCGSTAA